MADEGGGRLQARGPTRSPEDGVEGLGALLMALKHGEKGLFKLIGFF